MLPPVGKSSTTPRGRRTTRLEDVELDADQDRRIAELTDEADADIAASDEVRVNFRWGRAQVDTLKQAAAIYGVPYQTYLKMVALRAAREDLAASGS